jgi:hypothetical protein
LARAQQVRNRLSAMRVVHIARRDTPSRIRRRSARDGVQIDAILGLSIPQAKVQWRV